jgi:hypothetical protein
VAAVSRLVSDWDLLKGGCWECTRLHCAFHTKNIQYTNWYFSMFHQYDLLIFNNGWYFLKKERFYVHGIPPEEKRRLLMN